MPELARKLIAENKNKFAEGKNALFLDLGNCNLIEIPKEVGDCIWLENLKLVGNSISDLSPLANLTNLRQLDCSHTAINDLYFIARFKKLKVLLCKNTNITNLDPLIELDELFRLDISQTQVSDLSPILFMIKRVPVLRWANWYLRLREGIEVATDNLKILNFKGVFIGDNQLVNPPNEIVKQGNDAILNYFAERGKTQFKNTEIKLILVGNATAGKTSLSRFLRERNYQSGEPTTHGILNNRWTLDGLEMHVSLWDFGGQEYYHATHRLFLSRNAVYVLPWDKQTNKGGYCETSIHFDNDSEPSILKLEHFPQKWWVQNIRHYTHGSNPQVPVLLVQNKCVRDGIERITQQFEKPPFNLLPEWLDNHIDLEATADLAHPQHKKWLRQFETFEERLLDKLQSQLAHYEFAVYHREIRDEVRQLASEGVNDLAYSDFEALCRRFDPEAKMDLVQIYLRDITGDILYYPNNKRLKERVFLRPNWVCDSIYKILSRKVQEQEGRFDKEWVQVSLQCDEKNALDFVELLREFELVFEDTDVAGQPTGQLVAPQYLPENCTKPDKLEAAKEYANLTHAFTLLFPDFLPKSHIARFVANWGSKAKQRLFWKNGLLFQTEGCTALVERTENYRIRVDVQVNQPKQQEAICQIF